MVLDVGQASYSFDVGWFLGFRCASSYKMMLISGQSVPLGLLAASTLRMKCFWSPYICLLASAALSDPSIWSAIVAKVNFFPHLVAFQPMLLQVSGGPNRRVMNFTRHLILLFVILLLASHQKPIIDKEMEVNNSELKSPQTNVVCSRT